MSVQEKRRPVQEEQCRQVQERNRTRKAAPFARARRGPVAVVVAVVAASGGGRRVERRPGLSGRRRAGVAAGRGAGREGDRAADEHRAHHADRQAGPDRQEARLHQLRRRGVRDPGRHHQAGRRRPRLDRQDDRRPTARPSSCRTRSRPRFARAPTRVILNAVTRSVDREAARAGQEAGRAVRDAVQRGEDGRRHPRQHRGHPQQRPDRRDPRGADRRPTARATRTRSTSTSPRSRSSRALGDQFKSSYKKYCPDCEYGSIDIPVTSLGKDAPDRIVSYLRSHPEVNHVVLSVSNALGAGLPAALRGGRPRRQGQDHRPERGPADVPGSAGRQHRGRRPVRLLHGRLPDARRARAPLRGVPLSRRAAAAVDRDGGQHARGRDEGLVPGRPELPRRVQEALGQA